VSILFMLVGAGLIGAGLFATDPLSGYPPGTPPAAVSPSLHRVLHDLFSTPVFTALPAALHHLGSSLREAPQNRLGDLLRRFGRNDDHIVRDVQHRICAGITVDTNRWPVTTPHARGGLPLDGTAWAVEFDDTNQSLKFARPFRKGHEGSIIPACVEHLETNGASASARLPVSQPQCWATSINTFPTAPS